MSSLGLPVPPGFTITTEVCTYYYNNDRVYPSELDAQVQAALAHIATLTGRNFGDAEKPLLVSVRSGARASMPGMMDTVLNLGLNDETVQAIARESGDERFAYDSYRRFIQMYSDVVLGVDHGFFEEILEDTKADLGVEVDTALSADDWKNVIGLYKAKVEEELGQPFPQDPREQLWGAIGAVFSSWMNARAITYRRLHNIPAAWGTAVNVQAMVFGNMGKPRLRALPSRATHRQAKTSSMANSSSMPRAKTWWPVSVRRKTSPRKRASPPVPTSPRLKR